MTRGARAGTVGVAALIAASTGCADLVVHSTRHAPGHVDLSTPPARERGEPDAYEPPSDPGENVVAILPGAGFVLGTGRNGGTSGEVDVHLRFTLPETRARSLGRDQFPAPWAAWGGTIGWGIAQVALDHMDHPDHRTLGGPIYAEVNRSWIFAEVGVGAAVYPTNTEVGPQISASLLCYTIRARYLPDSGFEIFGGYQAELPTIWAWSR